VGVVHRVSCSALMGLPKKLDVLFR
jgi:hypothetical protein